LYELNAGDRNSYLLDSSSAIHLKLGKSKIQADFDKLASEGFIGTIEDLNKVCHLDGSTCNVKLSNLMNLPSQWNQAFIKPKGAVLNGKKWISRFKINGSDKYSTVYVGVNV
jgi:hypothetical protein